MDALSTADFQIYKNMLARPDNMDKERRYNNAMKIQKNNDLFARIKRAYRIARRT